MTSIERPKFDLGRFIPFRLWLLSHRMTKVSARVYAGHFNLSAQEWRVLAVLGRFGGMPPSDVAARTAMDEVRVSRTVTRLLRSGDISRLTDPLDRRRALLDLTVKGRNLYAKIVPLVLTVEADLLQDLTEAERAALEAAMKKLEARLAVKDPENQD
jgi:DNA-binding MarR family transcriptional regulator